MTNKFKAMLHLIKAQSFFVITQNDNDDIDIDCIINLDHAVDMADKLEELIGKLNEHINLNTTNQNY
jgi:hypothetical protein